LAAADAHKEGLIGGPLDGCVCDLPPARAHATLSHLRTVASTMIQRLAHSAALLATIASTAHAQRTAAANCAAVQTQHRTDVKITEAVAVAATRDTTTPVHVAHCRVAGIIGKEIRLVALLRSGHSRGRLTAGAAELRARFSLIFRLIFPRVFAARSRHFACHFVTQFG
jgi:hypothetical protein